MARKRKTLPKEYEERVKLGDWEKLKQIIAKCEPNAVGGYGKTNSLGFYNLSKEFVHWLIEYGADINFKDLFEQTPLHYQAEYPDKNLLISLYLDFGAHINAQNHLGVTPLHKAADRKNVENIKILLSYGADVTVCDWNNDNPLEYSLRRCQTIDIPKLVSVSSVLLNAGIPITFKAKSYVKEIGDKVEFYRADFEPTALEKIDIALNELYSLFGVVPQIKKKHDGISPIEVPSGEWREQYVELWNYLVPGIGSCQTVQGEVIRLTGNIATEILVNGGVNWDQEYQKNVMALKDYLKMGISYNVSNLNEMRLLIDKLYGRVGEDDVEKLCEMIVQWVLENPNPIKLHEINYSRYIGGDSDVKIGVMEWCLNENFIEYFRKKKNLRNYRKMFKKN